MKVINNTTDTFYRDTVCNFQKWFLNLDIVDLIFANFRTIHLMVINTIALIVYAAIAVHFGNDLQWVHNTVCVLYLVCFLSFLRDIVNAYTLYASAKRLFVLSCKSATDARFLQEQLGNIKVLLCSLKQVGFPDCISEASKRLERDRAMQGFEQNAIVSYFYNSELSSDLLITFRDECYELQTLVMHVDRVESVFDIVEPVIQVYDDKTILQIPNNGHLIKEDIHVVAG